MLLTLTAGCYGGDDVTAEVEKHPESSIIDSSVLQEIETTPEATETASAPETTLPPVTTIPSEATAIPETTIAPETTEPPVIIPQASVTTFEELKALAADDKLEAGTVIRIIQKLNIQL